MYFETHRATICQGMSRTVQFVRRFPAMHLNGDFSHWYVGQEMVYGGFENKFAVQAPVLDRVRFLCGRIASPGCIQVPVDLDEIPKPSYVKYFRHAAPHEYICFAPKSLGPEFFHAQLRQHRRRRVLGTIARVGANG